MFDPATRVLVVDDTSSVRKLVVELCRNIGFTDVIEASDGEQAWLAISRAAPRFGLVISDWMMPNCDGVELVRRLRGEKTLGQTPFLLMTGLSERGLLDGTVEDGVDCYVVKPFTLEDLAAKLVELHAKYRMEQDS